LASNRPPGQAADTLTVGEQVYTFSEKASGGNNIQISGQSLVDETAVAQEIYSVLSGDSLVSVSHQAGTKQIKLTAKIAEMKAMRLRSYRLMPVL
jgi:hypothetical protein